MNIILKIRKFNIKFNLTFHHTVNKTKMITRNDWSTCQQPALPKRKWPRPTRTL